MKHIRQLTALTSAVLAAVSNSLFAAQTGLPGGKVYVSPDGQLRAIVQPSGKLGDESRIEIRISHGRRVYRKDFGSSDGEHGKGVAQASWTPDSKFFVWSMTSSGGHHPWSSPIDFYSRRLRSSRSLDAIVGGITGGAFLVKAPNTVNGTRLDFKNNNREVQFSVKLGEQ